MASRTAVKRLNIEYRAMKESPPPYIEARPSDNDISQWYYLITGPPDTSFEGGQYYGEIKFPPNYPMGPPSIRMFTPSGRFQPGARSCLNMSDFHPETWNPAWNTSTILTGLSSFMCSSEIATGAIQSPPSKVKKLTRESVKWNSKDKTFNEIFPDIVEEIKSSVSDVDAVSSIEVVPPKASDLVAKLGQKRENAYKEAAQRAISVNKHSAESEAKASECGSSIPSSSFPSAFLVFALVALAAAGSAAFYSK